MCKSSSWGFPAPSPSLVDASQKKTHNPSHNAHADNYYIAFPKDVLRYKILLYGIYALEAAQTFIVTYDAFHTFAVEFGKPNSLMQVRMTWFTVPVVGGIGEVICTSRAATARLIDSLFKTLKPTLRCGTLVGCVAKLFYAYRISILMQSWKVGSLIALVSAPAVAALIDKLGIHMGPIHS